MANSRNPIEDIKRRRAEMRDQQQQEQTSRNPERDIAARTEALRQELGNPVQEDRQAETVNDTDIVKYEPESGSEQGPITEESIALAEETLRKYKDGKANLENRIIENEQWWKLRHWETIRKNQAKGANKEPEPTSAWLFNSLANKHADAMDNYPSASVLPREQSDNASAEQLSEILPVIIEQNGYKKTYSAKWWYKLKQGSACEGVFWNPQKYNGLGDIEIKKIDLLNLFWEPGIENIQDSRNIFHVCLRDNDLLTQEYPQLKGKLGGKTIETSQYIYDDNIDTSEKSVVVDWYYKRLVGSRTVLHYCKFCNGEVLFASENDPQYAESGFYNHGKYPFVCDTLFPEEGSLVGFGYLDIMKDPQMQIDKYDQAFMQSAVAASRRRFFINAASGKVNEEEFLDVSRPFVRVDGRLGEDSIKEITMTPLNDIYVALRTNKIDELKETSGNRDFSQGSTTSGVTAASAIAALQEAGSKLSRDMIQTSYDSYEEVLYLCIELIRQFYDAPRSFRITGKSGEQEFVSYDNRAIQPEGERTEFGIDMSGRMPIFDIKVRAQRNNPFSRLSHNELALQFYNSGFFNPEMTDQALACIDMMDFEGKDSVVRKISQNGTLYEQLKTMQQQLMQMAQIVDAQNGTTIGNQMAASFSGGVPVANVGSGDGELKSNSLGETRADEHATAENAREKAASAAEPR